MRTLALAVVVLSLAGPASAAAPRFALVDLHNLARGSRNAYGDVRPTRTAPHAKVLLRCAADCRFGRGWLGFTEQVGPRGADVVGAAATPGRIGWTLRLTLSKRGRARWNAFERAAAKRSKRAGVPDVLAVGLAGRILAAPLMNEVRLADRRLELPGFSKAGARAAARNFSG